MLLAGTLVALQSLILITNTGSISLQNLGNLSRQTVSLILLQIVILACVLGMSAWLSLTDKEGLFGKRSRFTSVFLFVIGAILCVEGLASIALNGSIVSGTTRAFMIVMGLELYALGLLSMVAFVQNDERPVDKSASRFTAAIVFLLMMLPVALIIV